MKSFKQYINEIFDERIDAQLAKKLAKHSEEQLKRHKETLSFLKIAPNDPRFTKVNQQIKNREKTQKRLAARP